MSLGYRAASPRKGRSSDSGIVPLKRLAGVSWEKREVGRRRTKRSMVSAKWGLSIVLSYIVRLEK
jgi:hypothetical protein